MRVARFLLVVSVACFAAAVAGVATTWTGATGSVLMLIAACGAAIAMEERDHASAGFDDRPVDDPAPRVV